MFERFTNRARHVVVLAQNEARNLQHNYIGTEHLLLGLLAETESTAARVLAQFEITLASARQELINRVAPGRKRVGTHIPFTPRGKKVLELSLREALSLHHTYIGTEHLLLGIIREGEGVGAQIIAALAGELPGVRTAVLDALPAGHAGERRWLRPGGVGPTIEQTRPYELRATPAADASLDQAARLAGTRPVGSHHLLLAAIADPNSAATRALAGLGIDLGRAQQALREVDVTGTSDELPDEAGRRQMRIQVTEGRLTVEITDPALLGEARATLQAITGVPEQTGTIRGDQPGSASLASVWRAIHDSLTDIRRRGGASGGPAGPGTPDEPPGEDGADGEAAAG